MADSPGRKVPTAVRLSFAAVWLALGSVAAALIASAVDAFPIRIVLIVAAVVAIAAAGACLGAAQKRIGRGKAGHA